jgi:PAS domain S-box-containing protein
MNRAKRALLPVLASVPPGALVAVMVGLYLWGPPSSHESAELLLVLNISFTTLVSGFIAVLAGRSFLTSGRGALLGICVGMIVWGVSALVAVLGEHVGNYNITIHNLGVALSGLCHVAGAVAARRYGERAARAPGAWLSLGVAAGLGGVGAIWMSTQERWLPPFFVEGVGATRLRTAVLAASIGMFAAAAALTWARYRVSGWGFLLWYSLGLALIGAGAVGLILQPTHGSWLGWVARATQYLGGAYMLTGTVVTIRESGRWQLSMEERLIRSEQAQREQADLIRTINDNTNELIFMKDRGGRLTYANAATLRLLGRASLANDMPDLEFFRDPAEHAAISANDRRVMETGQAIEAEDIFTCADGLRRTFLSTKSPLRDPTGQIIGVIGVSRDITERIAAQEKLRRALEAAETAGAALREADRRKDEFLATLAHELRGPLAPLRNMAEVLKRADGDEGVRRQAVGIIERQLGQLVRLVDDLIDISRITRDRIELRKERVELAPIIHQAVEACRPLVECANHRVRVALPPQPIHLHADPVRLAQVFSNVVNNACKYTEPDGKVEVSVERQGSDVVVQVKDSGLGIPADQLTNIFEMFTQVDRTLERSQGGLGIGLTLVRRLTEMHGGTVTAHSEGPGKGSEFIVRLPILIEARKPDTPSPASEPTGTRRRFLVVDDNPDSASSLALLLTMSGHQTQTAHDGLEAVQAAERFRPDVVLLDIGLPKLNGYEACRRIRQQPSGKDVVVVALTGWGQEEDRRKSKDAGFDYHMIKPVDYAALMTWLASRFGEESQRANVGS